ncbi:MAG: hypothetical protein V2A70_04785 [Candidatus Omnitrophota bacterium]
MILYSWDYKNAFSGSTTYFVFRVMLAVGLMSFKTEEIPYREILQTLGLNSELIEGFTSVISTLDFADEFQEFALDMESAYSLVNDEKGNPIAVRMPDLKHKKEFVYDRKQKILSESMDVNTRFALEVARAEDLLPRSFDFLSRMTRFMRINITEKFETILFSRAKSEKSLRGKIEDGKMFEEVFDYNGGRIAGSEGGVELMSKGVDAVIKGSELYMNFKQRNEKEQMRIEEAIRSVNLLRSNKKSDELKRQLGRQLAQLKQDAINFNRTDFSKNKRLDLLGHRVLVYGANYYELGSQDRGYTPDWYRAFHLGFMLGEGDSMVEVQVKTLLMAVLQSWEHKEYFKAEDRKAFPFRSSLLKIIWLANAVEAANYVHSKKKSFIPSMIAKRMEDFAQKQDQYGGIDVRHVEARLKIKEGAGTQAIDFKSSAMPSENLDGFTPRIISIQTVQGLAFIENP